MSILKTPTHTWLQLAIVPFFSMAVLVGCGSDDDDAMDTDPVVDTGEVEPGASDMVIVGDADGNNIVDAFETLDPTADANGNGIADVYEELAPGAPTAAADINENGVDDSYEIILTAAAGGVDENADGVDDSAAGALANGGQPVRNP